MVVILVYLHARVLFVGVVVFVVVCVLRFSWLLRYVNVVVVSVWIDLMSSILVWVLLW